MKTSILTASLMLGLCFVSLPGYAQTVKKWVDEQGVTHYSDQKPLDGATEAKEIEVPKAGVTEFDAEDANERIQKQLQQMEQDREVREREAEQKQKAKALEEALEREPIVVEEKKKKKKRSGDNYTGPYPKPPPGPFPKPPPGPFPQPVNPAQPAQ